MSTSTNNTLTIDDMTAQNYQSLSAQEIKDIFSETTTTARYFYNNTWYMAATNSFQDGRIEGQNNVGSYNEGRWSVDEEKHTLSLEWDGYWEDWTARGYKVDNEFMFFNTNNGKWRITLIFVEKGILSTDL